MIIATKKKKKETSKEEDKNNTWVKATEDTKKIKEVWSDGYDFGDVTKTILGVSKIAKDTTKDALVNIGKGFMSTVEGSVDSIRYGMSDIYRKLAEKNPDQTIMTGGIVLGKPQQISDKLKENAQYEVTKNLLGEENDIFKENWSAKVDEKSVLGNKSDSIFQGVGNVGAFIGMSQLTGGSNLSTFMNSFSSAYGNARSEAYKQGADDKTANRAGWVSGLAEGISEQFFSGIPGMKTAGWGDALNSRLSQAIQKYLGSTAGKVALTFFDGLGEGSEEVISNMLNATFTDIMHYLDENYTYGMDDMSGNIPEDVFNSAFSQDSLDSFISAMFTSLLTGGGKQIVQNTSNAKTSTKVAKQSDMSKSQANEIMEKIAERRANLTLEEDANYKERTEAIESARQQLNKEIRQQIKQGNTVDLNELFNQTPADNTQAQFTFNNDEIKNVRTDKQNVLANDMAKLNNVKSNHDLYKTINAIQSANNTQQYHITTTEGLYNMGIVDKTADGKYVMKDGSPYVPRGLNYKDGDIYINADVGSQSGTQAVYHEMFESFKKASPNEYKQFKQMVKDIVGEESIQESIQEYTKMYGDELTDNIEDEIINDKFGELAESQDFINRISDNRTLLQKFIDTVKNMINYVKGTEQEKQLIKLQRNLEKEFAKRYKETDFSQNKGETAYSLDKIQGLEDYTRDEVKNIARDYINNTLLDSGIDAEIEGLEIIGSRNRGNARTDSDLDVVVELKGDNLREDDLFSTLNDVEDRLSIEGIDVDINPILSYESGTIQDYLKRSNQYDQEVMNKTRYSLSPTGEMVDSKGNKVTLEASEVETNIPIRDDAKLMAIHNLNESKFNGILDLGGLPVPSIAIMNTSINGHSEFGDMSLLFDKSTIDPKNRKNEVYDRDVWSPTFPRVEYEVNSDTIRKIKDTIGLNDDYNNLDSIQHKALLDFYQDNLENQLDSRDLEGLKDNIKANRDIQYSYLKSKGLIEPVYKTRQYNDDVSNEVLQQFLEQYQGSTDFSWNTPLNELSYDQVMELKDTIKRIVRPYFQEEFAKYGAEDLVDKSVNEYDNYNKLNKFIYSANSLNRNGINNQELDEYATLDKAKDILNKEEYDKWVDDTFTEELIKDKGIRNDKDIFTASGNRRSFKATHNPINLETLTKALSKGETKGGQEMTIFGTGFGRISAQTANQFKSIEDIRANQNRLMTREQATEIIEPLSEKLFTDVGELTNYYTRQDYKSDIANDMQAMDTTSQLIEEFAGKRLDAENLKAILRDYNVYDVDSIPQKVLDDIVEDLKQLKTLPTDYFEAKPQRAVGLDEIQMAVIPNTASQELKQRLQDYGIKYTEYDPSIEGDRNRVVNQFSDLKFSMTSNENIEAKDAPITQQELAPIRQDLSNITEQMNNLSNQIETLQNGLETTPQGYVETYNKQRNENIPTRNITEEEANTLQDALMQDEGYLRSLDEQANTDVNDKLIKDISKEMISRFDVNKDNQSKMESLIRDAVENNLTSDEIADKLGKDFSYITTTYKNEEIKEAKDFVRQHPIKVSDAIKKDIPDYNSFRKNNFGKITFSNYGTPVDVAYEEMSLEMPGYFPSDIINPTDQLQKIAEVVNTPYETTYDELIDQDYIEDAADYIRDAIINDKANMQLESQYDLEKNIQFDNTEDIAPTTIRTQVSIDDYIDNRDIAPVRTDKQTANRTELKQKLEGMQRRLQEMFVNRNYVIDEYARATGNNQIKFEGDMLNNVSSEAQYNINNRQTDINGHWIGEGLKQLFEPAKSDGLADVYNDYLFHKSNIERHAVGKGSEVPLVVSQQLVAQYENQFPQVKKWSTKLYKFLDNLLQEQVDSGLISQEKYNDYRGEHGIFRSYVPFYPGQENHSNIIYDDEGNIKSYSTLKRAKGGAGDVNQMLSMEEAIAKQVYASKRAIRQNELFKQIVESSDKYSDAMDIDVRDNPTNLDDSLYTTPEGDKILTAYINGEKLSAKITDELYNELSRDNENRIKQIEEDFSLITTPLQKMSNVRRNLITTWNPVFLLRNATKDIQDAAINSKHTTDMLANYLGTKKGSKAAIFELREAQTKEAQQFLALYGADNLYGDYSGKGNKFTRLNELIELAPRFAEFKASLQNGESVQQAIYNAREVTTNFGRGGYITKAMNRNGFTFLNANVQGLSKLVRNLSGENGVKGVTSVIAKGVLFSVLPSILNHLVYGSGDDKDEEYEALPDYVKDNYYLIKLDKSGKFLRIPKGRINAVFGSLARRLIETGEGEENALEGWGSNAWSQIGVGDSGGLQTIFTPLRQAFGSKNGEAWYGGDIVPTRLQNKPAGEQTDASIDAISNFLGENLGISPYKINYVLDQYSGGIGDVFLPMITPETTNGSDNPLYPLIAPLKDAFVVNSTDDNKYAGEFYDLKDKLQIQSNSQYATDEDMTRYKYMSEISRQMSDLYKERREVQADTTLTNSQKYAKVQAIQNEINNLAKQGLQTYKNAVQTENYSNIGDVEFYKNADGEWTKVSEDESEFISGLTSSEKTAYYNTKNRISGITKDYSAKTKNLDKDSPLKKQYSAQRKDDITRAIVNSGMDNYTKAMVYSKYYSDKDTMTNVVNAGYNVDAYITALNDIEIIRDKYSQKKGYTTQQRKAKTIAYINSLDMNIPQKAMLIRQYYSSFRDYNNDIVKYVSSLNIPYEDKVAILKGTGMSVNGNKVKWK